MMRIELELRNVARFRVLEYLADAGGTPDGGLGAKGEGWSARLVELHDAWVGATLRVARELLVIEGADEATQRVGAFMRRKLMRGGG